MDINAAINEIIFKYHIDQYYPHYRNMCEARRMLRNVVQNIVDGGRRAVFVANDATEIELVKSMAKDYPGIFFLAYDRSDTKLQKLENIQWQDYGSIYLLSYYGAEHAERWFRTHRMKYEWVYDLFERGGYFCKDPFMLWARRIYILCLYRILNMYPVMDGQNRFNASYTASGANMKALTIIEPN